MSNRPPRIVWNRPAFDAHGEGLHPPEVVFATPGGAPRSSDDSRLVRACFSCGIPTDPRATTPKEDAVSLLKLAAEAEHALMVQYLYSAGSVSRLPLGRTITDIAVEEMGHLITVQNLLLALTGRADGSIPFDLHLGRDGLRRNSATNPLAFILEPISQNALTKYTVVERPDEIPDPEINAKVTQMEMTLGQQGIDVNAIFALYAAIRWLFQPTDDPVGRVGLSTDMGFRPGWHVDASDFAEPAVVDRYASTHAEWGASADLLVLVARDHAEAIEAIDDVNRTG